MSNLNNQTAELLLAYSNLAFQNLEIKQQAEKLINANKELAYQNQEKHKHADELLVANAELAFKNQKMQKLADELLVANAELAFQNLQKQKLADELVTANRELLFQNAEKEQRAAELIVVNSELEKRTNDLLLAYNQLQNAEGRLKAYIAGLKEMMFMTSHCVRQPICNILGVAGVLHLMLESPAELAESVGLIKESALALDVFTQELTQIIYNMDKDGAEGLPEEKQEA